MALRRRQQIGKADGGFSYTYDSPPPPSADSSSSSSSASSLAAKAIRASSAYREMINVDQSTTFLPGSIAFYRVYTPNLLVNVKLALGGLLMNSVYMLKVLHRVGFGGRMDSSNICPLFFHMTYVLQLMDPPIYDHAPKKSINGSKQGFWGVLAQKAKSIIDEDTANKHETPRETTFGASDRSKRGQYHSTYDSQDSHRKTEGPGIQKGLDAIASSLNYIGGTIGKSLEEGITAVENRTAGLIQETRKIQIRKKNNSAGSQNRASDFDSLRRQPMQQSHVQPKNHSTEETQLKASRDVEMATTAKAKLLMREMNTVKADFAFAKDRCAQLEEENRMLRESLEKGDNPDDDDLIRLQLESPLAEKARLAQENSVYARENRFLREIVEYH
ncbi:hypothetical protein SASPL_122945 [Salvia splendens]|uniref:Uncharacterized protein n=1 Tax=Salvia splendens TaxID=180675 RepID=A0A8X8XPA8_SALSN|nr:hypothetical protein SASPL_122945 [Salvia splendens]